MRSVSVAFFLAFALLGATASVGASDAEERFIVGYVEGAAESVARLVTLAGGAVEKTSVDLGFLVVDPPPLVSLASALAGAPGVAFVERDDPVRASGVQWDAAQWNGAQWNAAQWNGEPSSPGAPDPWGLAAINAPDAWARTTGTNRGSVCVVDSGVDRQHRDLDRNAAGAGYNAINGSTWALDDAGHGTHVAGIAAARVGDDWGLAGVGNVRVLAVKVLDATGAGFESDLAIGIAWCAQARAGVALLALGADEGGGAMSRALAYAKSRDVLIVASAGNAGPCSGCVGYPASDPRVLAVGSVGRAQTASVFSAAGPELALVAPGEDIASAFPGDRFASGTGTSQAAAFVAGAAALVRDANPTLSAGETRRILEETSQDLGPGGRDAVYGFGLLDAGAAVLRASGS